jgi:NADH-quinone oxidoreductase subunit N
VPEQLASLLWWMAVLTMTVGNVLALWQQNVKRVLAYSSVAHSGYLLVGLATYAWMIKGGGALAASQRDALQGVIFYVVAYGIMNAGAFGVLMLLPTRQRVTGPDGRDIIPPATSAETFEDIRGVGRQHPGLGLAMAVSCFSLIGLPLTVGFWGKVFLILPALDAGLYALVVITVINAAISAAYYLRIVGAMFLYPGPDEASAPSSLLRSTPITVAIAISVVGSLLFGTLPQAVELLHSQAVTAAVIETESTLPFDESASLDHR